MNDPIELYRAEMKKRGMSIRPNIRYVDARGRWCRKCGSADKMLMLPNNYVVCECGHRWKTRKPVAQRVNY